MDHNLLTVPYNGRTMRNGRKSIGGASPKRQQVDAEEAMGQVLRMIGRGPHLSLPFVNVVRGLYLLDSNENNNNENSNHGVIDPSALLGPPDPNGTTPAAVHAPPAYPQTPINRKKTKAKGRPSYPELCAIPPPPPSGDGGYAKASFASENSGMGATSGCGAVQHYSPLQPMVDAELSPRSRETQAFRRWANKRGFAKAKVKDTWASLLGKCRMASPDWRKVVLRHLRAVKNPSKVCRNLGAVVDVLIEQLELHDVPTAQDEIIETSDDSIRCDIRSSSIDDQDSEEISEECAHDDDDHHHHHHHHHRAISTPANTRISGRMPSHTSRGSTAATLCSLAHIFGLGGERKGGGSGGGGGGAGGRGFSSVDHDFHEAVACIEPGFEPREENRSRKYGTVHGSEDFGSCCSSYGKFVTGEGGDVEYLPPPFRGEGFARLRDHDSPENVRPPTCRKGNGRNYSCELLSSEAELPGTPIPAGRNQKFAVDTKSVLRRSSEGFSAIGRRLSGKCSPSASPQAERAAIPDSNGRGGSMSRASVQRRRAPCSEDEVTMKLGEDEKGSPNFTGEGTPSFDREGTRKMKIESPGMKAATPTVYATTLGMEEGSFGRKMARVMFNGATTTKVGKNQAPQPVGEIVFGGCSAPLLAAAGDGDTEVDQRRILVQQYLQMDSVDEGDEGVAEPAISPREIIDELQTFIDRVERWPAKAHQGQQHQQPQQQHKQQQQQQQKSFKSHEDTAISLALDVLDLLANDKSRVSTAVQNRLLKGTHTMLNRTFNKGNRLPDLGCPYLWPLSPTERCGMTSVDIQGWGAEDAGKEAWVKSGEEGGGRWVGGGVGGLVGTAAWREKLLAVTDAWEWTEERVEAQEDVAKDGEGGKGVTGEKGGRVCSWGDVLDVQLETKMAILSRKGKGKRGNAPRLENDDRAWFLSDRMARFVSKGVRIIPPSPPPTGTT